LVENPSPFDEEDAKLRKELKAKPQYAASAQELPANAQVSRSRAALGALGYRQQARDTVSGVATAGKLHGPTGANPRFGRREIPGPKKQ